jgi:hypothetical protein
MSTYIVMGEWMYIYTTVTVEMSWSLLCPTSIPIHLDDLDYLSVHHWLLCQQALGSGDIAQFQRLRAPVDVSMDVTMDVTVDVPYQLTDSPLLQERLQYVTQVFTDIPAGKVPSFDTMGLAGVLWGRALAWRRAHWQTMAYDNSVDTSVDTVAPDNDNVGTGETDVLGSGVDNGDKP